VVRTAPLDVLGGAVGRVRVGEAAVLQLAPVVGGVGDGLPVGVAVRAFELFDRASALVGDALDDGLHALVDRVAGNDTIERDVLARPEGGASYSGSLAPREVSGLKRHKRRLSGFRTRRAVSCGAVTSTPVPRRVTGVRFQRAPLSPRVEAARDVGRRRQKSQISGCPPDVVWRPR